MGEAAMRESGSLWDTRGQKRRFVGRRRGVLGDSGTAAPSAHVRAMGRVNAVRELWCIKEREAFPSAENIAGLMMGMIEAELGNGQLLHGPPMEVRAQVRESNRLAAPLATGLIAIIRSEVDDTHSSCLEKLRGQAW